MSKQIEGPIGWAVDKMIRRSVKKAFHTVWWSPLSEPLPTPCIFVANHHGWHDGYLMYHAVTALGVRSVDWIQEFAAFPLFGKVGGMPFPLYSAETRAVTIRKTIRLMRDEQCSLILFAEGVLHRPPQLLELGKSLDLICKQVPSAPVVPVGIRYEMSMHERPEAWLRFGELLFGEQRLTCRSNLQKVLESTGYEMPCQKLVVGTPDVNERWDMRNFHSR